jgi:hypothetical protein
VLQIRPRCAQRFVVHRGIALDLGDTRHYRRVNLGDRIRLVDRFGVRSRYDCLGSASLTDHVQAREVVGNLSLPAAVPRILMQSSMSLTRVSSS